MNILGIESSCDETAVAVYDGDQGLLAHALYSQAAMHADFGGVVPELASRDHVKRLLPLVRRALAEARAAIGGAEIVITNLTERIMRWTSASWGSATWVRQWRGTC